MLWDKPIRFNAEKNAALKKARGISFDEVIACIENDHILDTIRHTAEKFQHQNLLVVEMDDYAYVVPYVETAEEIFLKTIYPSRTMTKRYLG